MSPELCSGNCVTITQCFGIVPLSARPGSGTIPKHCVLLFYSPILILLLYNSHVLFSYFILFQVVYSPILFSLRFYFTKMEEREYHRRERKKERMEEGEKDWKLFVLS